MIFLLGLGLIFLLCFLLSVRSEINADIRESGNGYDFNFSARLYVLPACKMMEYHYLSFNFHVLPALQAILRRLKDKSRGGDFKSYLIRLGLQDASVENVNWVTHIGLQDAMQTGIGTGILWAIKGVAVSMVSIRSRLEKLTLKITPDYNSQIFSSNLNCIIRLRIVHIIFIKVYLNYLIVRRYINEHRSGKATGPPHRRAYENGYAEH